jgi:predicted NAD/FAD-binding protein
MTLQPSKPLKIAVIGTGISGMSAAWLLSKRHEVTVYERAERLGGHTNTVIVETHSGAVPVDTGFIVYNELNYPNLTALFRHLDVATRASEMSFSVSLGAGDFEYGGTNLASLFAQRRNWLRPRFWSMLRDLVRFYREAPGQIDALEHSSLSLGQYLASGGYGVAFQEDHLLPMAAAIWSASSADIRDFPAAAFLRFCENHGLLKFTNRPVWRTVIGGSRSYAAKLTASYAERIHIGRGAESVRRSADGIEIRDASGETARFDHVVFGTHADQALALLADPSPQEKALLGAFRYSRNLALLHSDDSFMPKRRKVWASWNYVTGVGSSQENGAPITYWMNRLQGLDQAPPLFVTLNPDREPRAGSLIRSEIYEHPQFDVAAIAAQHQLASLQGVGNSWYCGAYFGAGFHEDGLKSGLEVAEALGGELRPWPVADAKGWNAARPVRPALPSLAAAD